MANIRSIGQRGSFILSLQKALNGLNVVRPALKEDGVFGPKTHAAVIAFQRSQGLTADGIVGPITGAVLARKTPPDNAQRLRGDALHAWTEIFRS